MFIQRTKSCCALCSLKDRNKVPAEAPEGAKPFIAIFGEAPGKDEDREKKPFIGGSGSLLNWGLASAEIRRQNCFVGNVISCRPPDDDINSIEGQDAIPLCKGGFFEDLAYLERTGCRTILALGNTAMKAFGIEGAITKNRGSVYEYKFNKTTFTVIPTFHPSFLMHKHWKLDGGGTGDNGAAWIADIKKAKSIAETGWEGLTEDFNVEPKLSDVQKLIAEAIALDKLIAVDTETTSLDISKAKVVVCGLADSKSHGICIPFLGKHGFPYWHPTEEPQVKALLGELFRRNRLLFQNCFYDIPVLIRHGFEFDLDRVEDTLLLHHTLSPESEHNLGFIVSVYGKTPYWKGEFLNRSGSILDMDQHAMRTYNLRDCVVLHQVYETMQRDIDELQLRDLYNAEVKPLLAPVMEMRETGMLIDMKAMHSFKNRVAKLKEQYKAELYSLGLIPELNLDSDDEMRFFFFGELPSKFAKLADFENSNNRYREFIAKREQAERDAQILETNLEKMPPKDRLKAEKKILKLHSDAQKRQEQADRILNGKSYRELNRLSVVRARCKPIYTISETYYTPLKTDSEKLSVDAEAMLSLRIALNNRLRDVKAFVKPDLDEIAKIEKLLTFLATYQRYSEADKLLTTYTKYNPDSDGRIRPNWKAWGTATGRLSCSSPNLMNLPKDKEDDPNDPALEVRKFFIARPGWKFVSCDVVNLEVYILGYETLDPDLLSVTSQGLNIHDLNTKALFGIDETDHNWKMFRAAAKVYQFGRLNYGGSDYGVFRKVLLKCPDMRLTSREFAQASARWMALHPAYVQWKDELEKEVKSTRRTRTAFGRLRTFFGNEEGIVREALSTRIQSAGASVVNRAMRRIYDERRALDLKARFVCQVHDQLIMEAPDEEVATVQSIMVKQLERPFMFRGYERSVKVDPSIGQSFGDL